MRRFHSNAGSFGQPHCDSKSPCVLMGTVLFFFFFLEALKLSPKQSPLPSFQRGPNGTFPGFPAWWLSLEILKSAQSIHCRPWQTWSRGSSPLLDYVLSCVWLCNTMGCSSPLGFSRWKYWSRLPLSPPGDLPNPGNEPTSPASPALQEDSWLLRHPGSTPTPWIRIDTFHCVIQSICNTKNCKEQHFSVAGDILQCQSMAYRIAMEMGWGSGWGRKAQFWCWFCYQLWATNKHSIALLWSSHWLG